MYLCQKLHWDGIAIISCQLLEKRQVYESCLDPFLGNFSAFDEEVFNSFALSQSLIFLSQMVDTDTQSFNCSICDFLTITHIQLSNKIFYSYHWSEINIRQKINQQHFYTLNLCSTFPVFANSCLLHQFLRCLALADFQVLWHKNVHTCQYNYEEKLSSQFASPNKNELRL